jgi:membrane-associated protease RseP (regulator of RpoE activity)
MIITSINGQNVKDSEKYLNVISDLKPNQNVIVSTNKGEYQLTTSQNPNNESRGYLGILASAHVEVKKYVSNIFGNDIPWILFNIYDLFKWIFLLNFGVGLFNLLPIRILDGGALFKDLLSFKLSERLTNQLLNTTTLVFVAIIVFSLVYGMFNVF